MELLVKVEDVYAVLRSERPLGPTRDIALALLEEALREFSGTSPLLEQKIRTLRTATGSVQGSLTSAVLDRDGGDWANDIGRDEGPAIRASEVLHILDSSPPIGEMNRIAVQIIESAAKIGQGGHPGALAGTRELDAALARLRAVESGAGDNPTGAVAELRRLLEELLGVLVPQPSTPAGLDPDGIRQLVAEEIRSGLAEGHKARWSADPLSEKIGEYVEAEVSKLKGAKHREDVPRRLRNFLSVVGDKPVREITRKDLESYRDLLDELPDRYALRLKVDDMRRAVELNRKRSRPLEAIGPSTVDLKYLGPVRRLFDWLVKNGAIEKNPAEGVRSNQIDSEAPNAKRLPFKPEQITRIFASTSRESRQSALYWLPLLLLYTGARPNELAQMQAGDIREYNGFPHLSVVCLEDDDNESDVQAQREAKEDGRLVKTAAGRRLIPIHPALIQAGFVRFVESRRARGGDTTPVFRDLKPNRHGHWSAAITKRLNRRIDSVKITNPRYSVYSFRHTFADACRTAGIPKETRMKFMGHQIEGLGGTYGNPLPRPEESAWIAKIAYPEVDHGSYDVQSAET